MVSRFARKGLAILRALAVMMALRWGSWPPGPSFFQDLVAALPDSRVRDRLAELAEIPLETPVREVVRRFGRSPGR